MEEIYWITRLGNIQALFIALTIILGILTAIFSFALLVNISEGDSTNSQKKAIKKNNSCINHIYIRNSFYPYN